MKGSLIARKIAIIGAGPSGLFLLKNLMKIENKNFSIDIFEAGETTGSGFPYSPEGANFEHITNVSGNEIPSLLTSTREWLQTLPAAKLQRYGIDLASFNDYHVFPRLLFGEYLHAQFDLLILKAAEKNVSVTLRLNSRVTDIIDDHVNANTTVQVGEKKFPGFDHVVICNGHQWSKKQEGCQPGWYDSPYPPVKIKRAFNHAVAIKGSSLTAIDAVRTLARENGRFKKDEQGRISFIVNEKCPAFHIDMYSLKGLLPGVRFHLEDTHLSGNTLLTEEQINYHRQANDGFVSLDFIFDNNFKEQFRKKDKVFFEHIKDMRMEAFVEEMMNLRERADAFQLLKTEYAEARLSIKRKKSVYWKEMLATLSFAMNYPAKYFSAEDMLRLQTILMPLISVIIAFVPQDSCEELLALFEANRLTVIPVEKDSHADCKPGGGVVYHYKDDQGNDTVKCYETYIDCTGQPHLWINDFPFKTIVTAGNVSQALLRFRSAQKGKKELEENNNKKVLAGNHQAYFLQVPGVAINDCFQLIEKDGKENLRLYIMAVPFIGGYNPDYSGLDFCEAAGAKIASDILK